MGNTFSGYIAEFPGVRVDCFDNNDCPRTKLKRKDVKIHLLTHAHTDHMIGFQNGLFTGSFVYASPLTKEIVGTMAAYRKNKAHIKAIEPNKKTPIKYGDGSLNMTLIPSNHCPGSVMFLLESETKAVLLTGDIRAEQWWVDSLPRNPFLFPYTTELRTIDTVYLDTTYQYRSEPYIQMNQNHEGLRILTSWLALYPMDGSIRIHLTNPTLGFEEAWAQLATLFDQKFHSTGETKTRTEVVYANEGYDYGRHLVGLLEGGEDSCFHVCGDVTEHRRVRNKCYDEELVHVRLRGAIDMSFEAMLEACAPYDLEEDGSVPTGFTFQRETKAGHRVYNLTRPDLSVRAYVLPKGSKRLLSTELVYFFSRHSAYSELRRFISLFKVNDIYPIVEDNMSWLERGFSIQRHFGDILQSSEHRYDKECMELLGEPSNPTNPHEKPWTVSYQLPPIHSFTTSFSHKTNSSTRLETNDKPHEEFKAGDFGHAIIRGQESFRTPEAEARYREIKRRRKRFIAKERIHRAAGCVLPTTRELREAEYQEENVSDADEYECADAAYREQREIENNKRQKMQTKFEKLAGRNSISFQGGGTCDDPVCLDSSVDEVSMSKRIVTSTATVDGNVRVDGIEVSITTIADSLQHLSEQPDVTVLDDVQDAHTPFESDTSSDEVITPEHEDNKLMQSMRVNKLVEQLVQSQFNINVTTDSRTPAIDHIDRLVRHDTGHGFFDVNLAVLGDKRELK